MEYDDLGKDEFLALIDKHLEGKTTLEEDRLLLNYFDSFQDDGNWHEELGSKSMVKEKLLREVLNIVENDEKTSTKPYVKYLRPFLKYAALLVGFTIGGYYLYQTVSSSKTGTIENLIDANAIILTKGDGKVEVISEEGESKVYDSKGNLVGSKNNSQIDYTKGNETEELVFNELSVPYGKRFDIMLSDGTKIKLNSGTTLRYPVKFLKGRNREVILDGEAYFDVEEDVEHPFVVSADDINIEVLGTEFNVSYFPEDASVSTVLIEGSVVLYEDGKSSDLESSTLLKPGHLASWYKSVKIMSTKKVDTDIYTAWKNGLLLFKNESFRNIRKKLERYYDITIINNYGFLESEIFTASFDDSETIDNVMEYFNEDTPFHYTIENNKLTIEPHEN